MANSSNSSLTAIPELSTREVAQWLGVTVRTVQLMVDRGDLRAWKTPGGHRRIDRASVEAWRTSPSPRQVAQLKARSAQHRPLRKSEHRASDPFPSVVLAEPSATVQRRVCRSLRQANPDIRVHTATEAVTAIALCSMLRPHLLVLNAQLPGMDGTSLVRALAHHAQLQHLPVLVLTPSSGWEVPANLQAPIQAVRLTELQTQLPDGVTQWLTPESVG